MKGPALYRLAWRNIWRNRRRTMITLVSIAFGTLLATLFTGIGDSSYGQMIDHAAGLGGGHVVVQHRDFAELPTVKKSVQARDIKSAAMSLNGVTKVVPRLTTATMLSTSANSTGAMVMGIDPTAEDKTTLGITEAIAQGDMFATAGDKGIILGATLAANLDVKLGKKVVYTLTDKSGEIATGLARVSGIVETGSPSIDGGIAMLPLDTLRKTVGYEADELSQVAIFVDDHRKSASVAQHLAPAVGEAVALPWYEAQPDLAGFIAMKEGSTVIMELIITVLIAAGIFNTLFVSVMERMREFGIMAAIGFSSRQLFSLIMWESLWIALCGLATGIAFVAWPYYYLNTVGLNYAELMEGNNVEVAGVAMDPILYVSIYPSHALMIAVAIVVATLAAGLYPAWRAGRVAPVDTIRLV